jgi:hypothetical protein
MRWITRRFAKVDRIACPWLITRFIDPQGEFVFLPPDTNWQAVTEGVVSDVPGCELGHHGVECSFDLQRDRTALPEVHPGVVA